MLGVLPDWWSKKDYVVLKAIETFGSVNGRKALHKILYFANLKTRTFKYQWYTYGPYSPELAYKIADHVCDRSIDVKEDKSGDMIRYNMSLSESGSKLLANDSHEVVDYALDQTHELLRGMSPRQMELLASIHFIISCNYERSKAGQILRNLKPMANFTDGEVEQIMPLLENRSLAKLQASGANYNAGQKFSG